MSPCTDLALPVELVCMWMLSILPALGAASETTCDYGDSLADIVGIALRSSGHVVIQVDTDCDVSGIDLLELYPGSGGAEEFTIVPVGAGDVAEIPPLSITGGVKVHLERVRFASTSADVAVNTQAAALGVGAGLSLYVEGAYLEVTDVELVGGGGAGLVLVDSELIGDGLSASGFGTLRPLYVIADTTRTTVELAGLDLEENPAGAVALWGASQDVAVTLTGPVFVHNGPAGGADIGAVNVATLDVTDGSFTRSVGVDEGEIGPAPVYVNGGSFDCTRCAFDGTEGTLATTIAAYLGTGDAVTLTEGTYAPASMGDPVMHIDSGGALAVTTATFRAAGSLQRYSGTTTIVSTRFDGQGGTPDAQALRLIGTDSTLDGVTFCDYSDNGWGFVGVDAGTLELYDSVFQGLALGGAPVVQAQMSRGKPALVVRDNTMLSSDAVLVGGTPDSLVFTNNLVAGSTGGLALDATPSGATVGWNLWWEVDEPIAGGAPGSDDVVDEDPRFVASFDPAVCGSGPWLERGSPANAAGDPSRGDGYGNPRSDIGAIDYDESGDPGDTGEDTGGDPGDTGTPDVDDSGLAGDTAALEPMLVGGALPPCGCGDGKGAAALLFAPLFLLRRRRA